MNKVVDIQTAISKIKSGSTVMLGGFTNFGCPLHLLYKLAEYPEIKDLTLVSEDLGYGGLPYQQGPGRSKNASLRLLERTRMRQI